METYGRALQLSGSGFENQGVVANRQGDGQAGFSLAGSMGGFVNNGLGLIH